MAGVAKVQPARMRVPPQPIERHLLERDIRAAAAVVHQHDLGAANALDHQILVNIAAYERQIVVVAHVAKRLRRRVRFVLVNGIARERFWVGPRFPLKTAHKFHFTAHVIDRDLGLAACFQGFLFSGTPLVSVLVIPVPLRPFPTVRRDPFAILEPLDLSCVQIVQIARVTIARDTGTAFRARRLGGLGVGRRIGVQRLAHGDGR